MYTIHMYLKYELFQQEGRCLYIHNFGHAVNSKPYIKELLNMAKQVVNMTKKEGLELLNKIKAHSKKKGYPGAVTKKKKA